MWGKGGFCWEYAKSKLRSEKVKKGISLNRRRTADKTVYLAHNVKSCLEMASRALPGWGSKQILQEKRYCNGGEVKMSAITQHYDNIFSLWPFAIKEINCIRAHTTSLYRSHHNWTPLKINTLSFFLWNMWNRQTLLCIWVLWISDLWFGR